LKKVFVGKMLRIIGNNGLRKFSQTIKPFNIHCKHLILKRLIDQKPLNGKVLFPEVTTIFVEDCDISTQKYWLTKNHFPQTRKLYLSSRFDLDNLKEMSRNCIFYINSDYVDLKMKDDLDKINYPIFKIIQRREIFEHTRKSELRFGNILTFE
jgi:hypothetical protein